MKHWVIFFALLVFPSLAQAQDGSQEQIDFVNDFKEAVREHDMRKIYRSLDRDYRKSQKKFLGGNKRQLLNELFAGTGITDEVFVVIPIDEILKFEVAEIERENSSTHTYIFRVRDANHDILTSLVLVKKGKRFGFVGAVG